MDLFQILAALLHLGNVEVEERSADSSTILASSKQNLFDYVPKMAPFPPFLKHDITLHRH